MSDVDPLEQRRRMIEEGRKQMLQMKAAAGIKPPQPTASTPSAPLSSQTLPPGAYPSAILGSAAMPGLPGFSSRPPLPLDPTYDRRQSPSPISYTPSYSPAIPTALTPSTPPHYQPSSNGGISTPTAPGNNTSLLQELEILRNKLNLTEKTNTHLAEQRDVLEKMLRSHDSERAELARVKEELATLQSHSKKDTESSVILDLERASFAKQLAAQQQELATVRQKNEATLRDLRQQSESDLLQSNKRIQELQTELQMKQDAVVRYQTELAQVSSNTTSATALQFSVAQLTADKQNLAQANAKLTSALEKAQRSLGDAEEARKMAEDSARQKERQLAELQHSFHQHSQAAGANVLVVQQQLAKEKAELEQQRFHAQAQLEEAIKIRAEAAELCQAAERRPPPVEVTADGNAKKVQILLAENQELGRRCSIHLANIEKLMQQKVQLAQTIATEVQRNGALTKENAQLKFTLDQQKQITASLGAGVPVSQAKAADVVIPPLFPETLEALPLALPPPATAVETAATPSIDYKPQSPEPTQIVDLPPTEIAPPPKKTKKVSKKQDPKPQTAAPPPPESTFDSPPPHQSPRGNSWFGAIGRMWQSPDSKKGQVVV